MQNDEPPLKLLVVDDDPEALLFIEDALSTENLEIVSTKDPKTGLKLFSEHHPQIVLLDLIMPKMSGMRVLEKMVAADPGVDIILVTVDYSTESAVEAIRKGACDYLTKPLDVAKLRARINDLREQARTRARTADLDEELREAFSFDGMIGRSPLMLDVFARIRRAAPHYRTALVTGMTGTGKELVARAMHRLSPVASGPFVVVNCSALVETLVESELFGYVKGAFTGAVQDKVGTFEFANEGTIFLDEIGEMPLTAQAKLLRVVQNQEVHRIGSPIPHPINVRVVAATNRNLRAEVAKQTFREDLYYRLSMVEIKVPALADRKEDIPLLQSHLLRKFANQYQKKIRGFTRRAQARLASHSWPGNVRELENVIGNACMMADAEFVDLSDLPEYLSSEAVDVGGEEVEGLTLEQIQQRHVLRVLKRFGGNKVRAAEALGISRATLYEALSRIKSAKDSGLSDEVTPSVTEDRSGN